MATNEEILIKNNVDWCRIPKDSKIYISMDEARKDAFATFGKWFIKQFGNSEDLFTEDYNIILAKIEELRNEGKNGNE